MSKKRGIPLKSYSVSATNESYNIHKDKTDVNIQNHVRSNSTNSSSGTNFVVKQWLAERFKDKLQGASRLSLHTNKPIILYRKSIEESENATEEEICYISGNHIIQILYAYGGFIPSNFKNIEVFTIDKFTKFVLQERKKDLLLQCIESIEQ